jgi:hypothetical protein
MGSLYRTKFDIFVKAPLATDIKTFSPVIFSNGLGGLRDHYSFCMREMASHGYIVFARQYDEQFNVIDK